jgi:hypothetical protein
VRWEKKTRAMWTIQANITNQGYDLPDLVGKASDLCHYMPDEELYLQY